MDLIAGGLNKQWLRNLTSVHTSSCTEVRAAIAYASSDNMFLLDTCLHNRKPLTYYGRYDETIPVDPAIIRWFLDQASPNFTCRVVPDILHAKVIWWVDVGVYIGSANMTDRAWNSNIEAGSFMTQDEIEASGLISELYKFFDVVDARSEVVDDAFYKHLLELQSSRAALNKAIADHKRKTKRYFPEAKGLSSVDVVGSADKAFRKFERTWRESLQVLRDIAQLAITDEFRPAWIPKHVPSGAQVDQFVHAYYYKFVQGHKGDERVERSHQLNRLDPERALLAALKWWQESDFDFTQEKRHLLEWAPLLKSTFAKDRIENITQEEFVEAMSRVHAVRDYGGKRPNSVLGLPDTMQTMDTKLPIHLSQIWNARTTSGRAAPEVLNYVIWGQGAVEQRIWTAARSQEWRLPSMKYSTLGEVVGWARPDEFPPRNDRTVKGLKALGYNVRSV